ncbi:MAG: HAMP domain-containing histidine kinase, partial [Chloroflexi bacterium]|nr:HAMP domain-containing histidine kinase [Chloroflexota bacterium]
MMASSLRSRLLLSYGLLTAVLLCLVSAGAALALLRNPLVYEDASQQLRAAQQAVHARPDLFQAAGPDDSPGLVQQIETRLGVRAVLFDREAAVTADSQAGSSPSLLFALPRLAVLGQRDEIGLARDTSGRVWLVIVQRLDEQAWLVLAVRRPRLAFVEFFTSEFLRPVTVAGLVGLLLSLLISFAMAGWISAPLRRIAAASDGVAAGQFQRIRPEGPGEVKRLAHSFNHMVGRVQAAQQSQRDLVANVSHELKTPLTSIQGFTQAILDGVAHSPEEVHQAAQVIYAEANRMARLVQDLVSLARLEAGTADLQSAPLDMAALARAMADRFRPQAAQAGVTLVVAAPGPAMLHGDADRLAQVLSNLVDNAIKFTPAGG